MASMSSTRRSRAMILRASVCADSDGSGGSSAGARADAGTGVGAGVAAEVGGGVAAGRSSQAGKHDSARTTKARRLMVDQLKSNREM